MAQMTRFAARSILLSVLLAPIVMQEARCQTLAAPMQQPNMQFFDCRQGTCNPLAGGFLFSYIAGTTMPLATCATTTLSGSSCSSPNSNPVVLNSSGFNAAGSGSTGIWPLPARCYKFTLKDSASVTLWTIDAICNQTGLLQAALAGGGGAAMIGFTPMGGTTIPIATALNSAFIYDQGFSSGATACGSTITVAVTKQSIWNALSTMTCSAPLWFPTGAGVSPKPANGQTFTFTLASVPGLQKICDISAGGHCKINPPDGRYYPQWFGDTTDLEIQAASDAVTTGGEIYFIPGTYTFNNPVTPSSSFQTFNFAPGATVVANDVPFEFSNVSVGGFPSAPIALSSGTQGATTITVGSSATFTAGQRIIVSSGTFSGSGVEEGPLEYNTVAASGTGTTITLIKPLAYNYSGFGLASASPRIFLMAADYIHDIRITGGGMFTPGNAFGSAYWVMKYTENIEVDHITFNGFGNVLSTGGESQNFNFHDNLMIGKSTQTGGTLRQAFDLASMTYSFVRNNTFSFRAVAATAADQSNNFICEETCHDNIFDGNIIGPVVSSSAGAIALVNNAFNNTITNNRVWGLAGDVTANVAVLGLEPGGIITFGGNQVVGNFMYNIGGQCILDVGAQSVISENTCENDSVSTASVGITVAANSSTSALGKNSLLNMQTLYSINSGGTPGVPLIACPAVVVDGGFCQLFNATDSSGGILVSVGPAGVAVNTLIFTVTFARQYTSGAACTPDPANLATSSLATRPFPSFSNSNTATWTLTTSSTVLGNNTYTWNYNCSQHQTSVNR